DLSLAELRPALEGKQPVVFEADSRDEIHRALDFAEEFNLKPILYGGREAWKVADRLKEKQVPVLVRMNFSDRPQGARRGRGFGPPPAPATPGTPGTPGTPQPGRGRGRAPADAAPGQTPTGDSPDAEAERPAQPKRVEEDQQRQLKEEIHNATVLRDKGIPFAISTQGQTGNTPADKFKENLRKAITEGLKPEAARSEERRVGKEGRGGRG